MSPALTAEPTPLFSLVVEKPGPSGALLLTSADFDAFLESTQTTQTRSGTRASPGRAVSSDSASARASARPSPAVAGRGLTIARPAAATQRRALRERIEAWTRTLLPRLTQLGLPLEVVVPDELEQHLSSRAPRSIAQRVIFVRDGFARREVPRTEPERDPLLSHAYLALTIDSVHLEVSLEIGPEAEADVKNLRARLADPTALLSLLTLFETLPEEFAIGVIGVPSFPRAETADADEIRALLDDSHRNRRPLWIGWSVKREVALAHASELDEQLSDALVVLAQAYKLIAWAPDNDLIRASRRGAWRAGRPRDEMRERVREERPARKRRSVRKGPVRVEGSRREREDTRRPLSAAERESPVSRRPPAEREPRENDERNPRESAARAAPARRPMLQSTLRARGARHAAITEVDPSVTIEKGTRVRVLAGPFVNKVGVVQELDGKGRARVRLGLLAATVDLRDLVASTDGARPMLASSHRRPRKR